MGWNSASTIMRRTECINNLFSLIVHVHIISNFINIVIIYSTWKKCWIVVHKGAGHSMSIQPANLPHIFWFWWKLAHFIGRLRKKSTTNFRFLAHVVYQILRFEFSKNFKFRTAARYWNGPNFCSIYARAMKLAPFESHWTLLSFDMLFNTLF